MTEYQTETIFTWGAPPSKFGAGAIDELGHECSGHSMRKVLIVTDPRVAETGGPRRAAHSLKEWGIETVIFDGVHSEPADASLREAVEFASGYDWVHTARNGDLLGGALLGGAAAVDDGSESHRFRLRRGGGQPITWPR